MLSSTSSSLTLLFTYVILHSLCYLRMLFLYHFVIYLCYSSLTLLFTYVILHSLCYLRMLFFTYFVIYLCYSSLTLLFIYVILGYFRKLNMETLVQSNYLFPPLFAVLNLQSLQL